MGEEPSVSLPSAEHLLQVNITPYSVEFHTRFLGLLEQVM
jgi:hypothetical protein